MTTLNLVQPALNSTSWGAPMNTNLGLIDQGTALGQINLYNPVSITGTTALTSTAFGTLQQLSGTTGEYQVSLPPATSVGSMIAIQGLPYASLNQLVEIVPNGTDTIEGLIGFYMLWEEFCVFLCSSTGRWERIIWKTLSQWQTYTPVVTATTTNPTFGSTNSSYCFWKRDFGDILIQFYYYQTTAGTAGTGNYLFNLPMIGTSTLYIDANRCHGGGIGGPGDMPTIVGSGQGIIYGTTSGVGQVTVANGTALGFFVASGATTALASATWYGFSQTSLYFGFQARVPLTQWM
jgi:hypothetical protein